MAKNQFGEHDWQSPRLSGHAQRRCQQRGISQEIVLLLVKYGVKHRSGDGYSYSANPKTHLLVRAEVGREQHARISRTLSHCYVVVSSDSSVVETVAWRERRWRRR